MTWQPPLPVVATVVGPDDGQAEAAIRMFQSLVRFGGNMASVERIAYFTGDIAVEHAERLAELGVALKVVDAATELIPGAGLIPALLDADEPGFLVAIAPDALVRDDFAAWIDRGPLAARPHASGFDASVLLVRRDLAAHLALRWAAAVQELQQEALQQQDPARLAESALGERALALAIAREGLDVVTLPAGFGVVAGAARPDQASEEPASPVQPATAEGHMTPGFDNRAFWNHRYLSDPERGSGVGSRGAPRALKESLIRRAIETFRPADILDVGCGDLASVESLPGSAYTGIDISEEVLRADRAKRPDWKFLCGDFVNLSGQHGLRADLVLCFDVLIHQHDRETYEAFVRQLVANCRGSGLVGAFQTPPRARYRSQITAYHEPITRTLARMGATRIKVIAAYRDTVVAQFQPPV